jgi:BirA family biotin operon repressor/biotin-[acetyl-CoA-carboxylase] ligase
MGSDLSPELITTGLKTKFIGKNVLYLPVTNSTMDVAREEAKRGAPEGTVVIAEEQTAGRGRLNREWVTPSDGAIALSVLLYPDVKTLPYLIMVASLAVVESIRLTTGLTARIKWPNDVLLGGKKVAGILIENSFRGGTIASVIGIGINVNLRVIELPEIAKTATSLFDVKGEKVARLAVVRALFEAMESLYGSTRKGDSVFVAWRENLVTLGKPVRVTSPQSVQDGVAESVNADGSLMLRKPDGTLIKIVAEDVTLRE